MFEIVKQPSEPFSALNLFELALGKSEENYLFVFLDMGPLGAVFEVLRCPYPARPALY